MLQIERDVMLGKGATKYFKVVQRRIPGRPGTNVGSFRQPINSYIGGRTIAVQEFAVADAARCDEIDIAVFCAEGRFPTGNFYPITSSRKLKHAGCRDIECLQRRVGNFKHVSISFTPPNAVIAKIPHSRRWRVTKHGRIAMSAAVQLRDVQFSVFHSMAAA
jgi:hypothetical protein